MPAVKKLGKPGRKPGDLESSADPFAVQVARALRACVQKFGTKPRDLMRKVRVSQTVYYRIYNATSPGSAGKYVSPIASAFGLSPEKFLKHGLPSKARK